jgi:hypothetical protein
LNQDGAAGSSYSGGGPLGSFGLGQPVKAAKQTATPKARRSESEKKKEEEGIRTRDPGERAEL